jgi:hypothetical protein
MRLRRISCAKWQGSVAKVIALRTQAQNMSSV